MSKSSPEKTFQRPGLVEFRTPAQGSVRVVRILTTTTTLRMVCFTETSKGQIPMPLFQTQIEEYFKKARELLK